MSQNFNRRTALKSLIAGTVAMGIPSSLSAMAVSNASNSSDFIPKGKINHSVARWCFGDMELEALCIAAKKMGITGIDLVGPKDWFSCRRDYTWCFSKESTCITGRKCAL